VSARNGGKWVGGAARGSTSAVFGPPLCKQSSMVDSLVIPFVLIDVQGGTK